MKILSFDDFSSLEESWRLAWRLLEKNELMQTFHNRGEFSFFIAFLFDNISTFLIFSAHIWTNKKREKSLKIRNFLYLWLLFVVPRLSRSSLEKGTEMCHFFSNGSGKYSRVENDFVFMKIFTRDPHLQEFIHLDKGKKRLWMFERFWQKIFHGKHFPLNL